MDDVLKSMYMTKKKTHNLATDIVRWIPIERLPPELRAVTSSVYLSRECFDMDNISEFSRSQRKIDGTSITLFVFKAMDTKPVWNALAYFVPLLNSLSSKMSHIDLILYDGVLKKMLPDEPGVILSPVHINSGLTDGRTIFVFRREEMFKVILHELIHYYGFDFNSREYESLENDVKKKIGLKSQYLALNECYTETLTTIFMIGYQVQDGLSFSEFCLSYESDMKKMITYSARVAGRILDYHKFEEEHTHVFSYYFAKAACLHHLTDFIKIFGKRFVIRGDDKKIRNFYALVLDWISDPHIIASHQQSSRSLKMMTT